MHVYKLVGKAVNRQLPAKVRPCKAITDPMSPCEQDLIEEKKRRICLNRVINQSHSESDSFKSLVPFEYFLFPAFPKVVTKFRGGGGVKKLYR